MTPLIQMAGRILTHFRGRSLSTLIYHRVLDKPDYMRPDEPTAAQFDWQMALLKRYFTPLPLREAMERLADNTLPANAVCVTFDDGYADNLSLAAPILQRHQIPATVFIATGFLNGGIMWNDKIIESVREAPDTELDCSALGLPSYGIGSNEERRRTAFDLIGRLKYLPFDERQDLVDKISKLSKFSGAELMMTDAQVVELEKYGVIIGAHTQSHPILTRLKCEEAEREIQSSRQYLEELLQHPITQFAYPNGRLNEDYSSEHCDLVERLGFELSVSTNRGVSRTESERFELKRFTPWDKSESKFLMRLYLNAVA